MNQYDVIIIGSGPSAVSAYDSLLRTNSALKICILEAGGSNSSYNGEYKIEVSKNFRLSPTIYMGEGGTSELWHYVLSPLDPIDFEFRPEINSLGWPIKFEDLKPYYERSLKLLGVKNSNIFDNSDKEFELSGLDLDDLLDVFEPKLFIQLKKRWRAKQYWQNVNAKIYYFHFVRALKVNDKNVEIISVDQEGKFNKRLTSKKVIVAAGALSTPQIIYNSDIDDVAKIHVGRTLLDHPMGVGMQVKRSKKYNFEILTSKKESDLNKKIAFRIKDEIQKKENLPNSSFYFRPSFKEGYSEATESLKTQIIAYRDFVKNKKIPFGLTLELIKEWNLVGQIIGYKTGLLTTVSLFDIFCVTEQVNRDSGIHFYKGRDGFYTGKCIWNVSQQDVDLNNRCLDKIVNWTWQSRDCERVSVYPDQVPWHERASSAAHHIGTVPMGANVCSGAVDSNCAVFGLNESVFVADASVMPSAGCANVTLTSMAIANRVGEYVGKTL